jgi:hypothetical protein
MWALSSRVMLVMLRPVSRCAKIHRTWSAVARVGLRPVQPPVVGPVRYQYGGPELPVLLPVMSHRWA